MSAVTLLVLVAAAVPVIALVGLVLALGNRENTERLGREIKDLGNRLAQETALRIRLERRLEALERRGEAPPEGEPKPEEVVLAEIAPPPPEPAPPQAETPPATSVPAVAHVPAPSPPADLESRLGARWAVWIGGLALALGGMFLVRYTIEQGLIGPAGRVALGAALSAALLAAGEGLRRSERGLHLPALAQAYVPGVLTAAGSSTAFATIFAAYELYGFLGPGSAFALLGLVSLATLAASLLHGPWLAALGILAAYVTPFLVSSDDPNAEALFLYLAFVTATATALGRLRLWLWLVAAAHGAAVAWALIHLGVTPRPDALLVGLFALALTLIAFGPRLAFAGAAAPVDRTGLALALGHGLILFLAVVAAEFQGPVLALAAIFVALHLAAAWRMASLGPLVGVAGLFAAAVLGAWDIPLAVAATRDALAQPPPGLLKIPPAEVDRFAFLGTVFGALFLAGGLGGAWRGASPVWLAGAAAIIPLALTAIGYARIAAFEPSPAFSLLSLGLAAALAFAAEASLRSPPRAAETSTALLAAGSVAGLCLGLAVILEKGWLTVALALVSLGLAWVEQRRPVAALRVLAAGVAGLVVLRLFWYPLVTDDPGRTPILNWLLWGYGAPALAFALAARLFRQGRDDMVVRLFEGLAIVYAAITISLQIRHFISEGDMFANATLAEVGLQTCLALAFSLALQRLHDMRPSPVFDWASRLFGHASLAMIVIGLGLVENPLLSAVPVEGSILVNALVPGYFMPAGFAALLAHVKRRRGETGFANATSAVAVALGFLWITLVVRRFFQGPELALGDVSSDELYAYSAAWLLYAVALLIAGVAMNRRWLRLASAAVMAPAVLKVFVIDMAHLEGVLRALSFIGLGLTLVGIGLLYQRLLVRFR